MKIYFKNKEIEIPVKKVSNFGMLRGLTFKSKDTENLLFEFEKSTKLSIHSYFVFFDFLAIWLDEKNKVVDFRVICPFMFKVKPKKSFQKLIEIPLNNKNKKIINYFVGKRKI